MRIAVVGSGGYVGVPLCKRLEEAGHELLRVDGRMWGQVLHPSTVEARHEGSIIQALADFGPELIYHLAALAHDLTGRVTDAEFELNNTTIPVAVATWASARRIPSVHTSSLSIYSTQENGYPESKRRLERRLVRDTNFFRDVSIVRFGTLFGWDHRGNEDAWRGHLLLNKMVVDGIEAGVINVTDPHAHRPVLELSTAVRILQMQGVPNRPRGTIDNCWMTSGSVSEFAGAVKAALAVHGYHADVKSGSGLRDARDYSWGQFQPVGLMAALHPLIHEAKTWIRRD